MNISTFFRLNLRRASASLIAMFCAMTFAQNPYTIQFQDEVKVMPENINTFSWDQMPEQARVQQTYIGWIQFYNTPTQDIQNQFRAMGLELVEYIPHKTYLFRFPATTSIDFLRNSGARSIVPVEGRFKLSEDLKNGNVGEWAVQGNYYRVTLQHHPFVDTQFVINDLASKQISVEAEWPGSTYIDLVIPDNCLEDLSNQPYVKWVEVIVAPSIPDDTRGKSLHRSSGLDTQTPSGRNYMGNGVGVLVRDDGIVGPHIDFEGRIFNNTTDPTGSHGDGVAGIMSGAGNLNPSYRGMAAGSDMYVVNYQSNFLDFATTDLIDDGSVQITNSSYSNGCNAGYTSITVTVDGQMRDEPTLLHVFSAGNSNGLNCGYGAGSQWGNITGGHKQGKNVIATANTFFDGSLVNSSSRGPAHDGRIKPDIAANGQNQISTDPNNGYDPFGGTSGAAPGIAGVAAQLYEAYEGLYGELPPGALIKAALLNTASDYGNVGPDYKFGWGIVNGLRAAKLIEDGRFLSDEMTQASSNTHTLNVPAGTSQIRIMLYWNDAPAASGANPALVNDLELVVTDPSSNEYLPWILDHTPNATTLNNPATNGKDHLNNMEQVLINNPEAGNYTIEVSGFNVPVGPQEYFILYEVVEEALTLTYPNAGEKVVAGDNLTIHWDAINTVEDFTLEYSIDNGGTWNPISTVNDDITNLSWTVPNGIATGEALIRITSGEFSDTSDYVFSIASQATGVQITQLCSNEASFRWDIMAGADSYDLFILGEKYMDLVGSTSTNSISVPISDPNDDIWYAVSAKNLAEGWTSLRTVANLHDSGEFNCNLSDDLSLVSINNDPSEFNPACNGSDVVVSITVRNNGSSSQSNFTVSYQLTGGPLVEETFTGVLGSGQQVEYDFTTTATPSSGNGDYVLTAAIDLPGDENPDNNHKDLFFYSQTTPSVIPLLEDFETQFNPSNGWSIENPDNDITWAQRLDIPGINGDLTDAVFMNNYSYDAAGEEDYLVTEVVDLNVNSAFLVFDLAKAQRSGSQSDELRVEISTDCGDTYTTIYDKAGTELATVDDQSSNWTPTEPSDWEREQVDLTDYLGNNVIFRFVNVNGFGNSTFIDNVGVNLELGTNDVILNEFALYPNPAKDQVSLQLANSLSGNIDVTIINSLGQVLSQFDQNAFNSSNTAQLSIAGYQSGLYFVTVTIDGLSATKKLIIQ